MYPGIRVTASLVRVKITSFLSSSLSSSYFCPLMLSLPDADHDIPTWSRPRHLCLMPISMALHDDDFNNVDFDNFGLGASVRRLCATSLHNVSEFFDIVDDEPWLSIPLPASLRHLCPTLMTSIIDDDVPSTTLMTSFADVRRLCHQQRPSTSLTVHSIHWCLPLRILFDDFSIINDIRSLCFYPISHLCLLMSLPSLAFLFWKYECEVCIGYGAHNV